jgi:hypothetical protein
LVVQARHKVAIALSGREVHPYVKPADI